MSGNGVDLGAVYQLLSQVAEAVTRHDWALEALGRDMAEMRRDMTNMDRSIKAEIADLRQTVVHYHASVIGHGILISDLDVRVRRIEEHLSLPSL